MEAFDWQALVDKPVYSSDRKDIGVVRESQPQKIIVQYGPITPDIYAIPNSSLEHFKDGVVYLIETGGYVEHNYKFE